MKKIKILVTCALAVGVLSAISLTSVAATKVNFSLYYTGTNVGSVLNRTYTIDGTSKTYRANCSSSSNGTSIRFTMPGGKKTLTIDQTSGTQNFGRNYKDDGDTTVSGSIKYVNGRSGGVQASFWKA